MNRRSFIKLISAALAAASAPPVLAGAAVELPKVWTSPCTDIRTMLCVGMMTDIQAETDAMFMRSCITVLRSHGVDYVYDDADERSQEAHKTTPEMWKAACCNSRCSLYPCWERNH